MAISSRPMAKAFPRNMVEFVKTFTTEQACTDYLSEVRWPDGFVCPVQSNSYCAKLRQMAKSPSN